MIEIPKLTKSVNRLTFAVALVILVGVLAFLKDSDLERRVKELEKKDTERVNNQEIERSRIIDGILKDLKR